MKPLLEQRTRMNARHKAEHNNLNETQKQHGQQESEGRQARHKEIKHLKTMMFSVLPPEMKARLQKQFEQQQSRQNRQSPDRNNDYDLSI